MIACAAPYGNAGLGQHLKQIIEEAREQEDLKGYYATTIRPEDSAGHLVTLPLLPLLFRYTPVRFSLPWKSYLSMDQFDRAVAAQLKPGKTFTGFVGQALYTFKRARLQGYQTLELEAANSHVRNVMRLHERARRQFGFEPSWLNAPHAAKTLREYAMADVIMANSDYTRDSLIAEGIDPAKVHRRHLQVHPRFQPPNSRPSDGVFRVVYTGSLTMMKGVPLLLEAFSRLTTREAELTLVGGWATRAMKVYMQAKLAQDTRICLAPGDPLPHLQRADVCVHPTYEDGFAYAPMEALACGTPVIVTEDTGMKEHVREGINGYVVPTGSWEAILERLEHLWQKPLTCALQAAG